MQCKQCTFLNPAEATSCEVCLARLPKRSKSGEHSTPAAIGTPRQPSQYNLFMKEEIARIKQSQPELVHKEAFREAARNWRAASAGNVDSHLESGEHGAESRQQKTLSQSELLHKEAEAAKNRPVTSARSDGVSRLREQESAPRMTADHGFARSDSDQGSNECGSKRPQKEEITLDARTHVCPACTFANPLKAKSCRVCQARLPQDEIRGNGEVLIAHGEANACAEAAEERACQSCTFLNLASATTCTLCHAKLPKGREREKAAQKDAAAKQAREEAARRERAYQAMPKATMEREGYRYHTMGDFPGGWSELVERAALAAEALLYDDAQAERTERRLETINSHRRQLRFVPEGVSTDDTPNLKRYVVLTASSRSIHDCARALKAQLGPEMAEWVAQDLYVLHTPREEEGSKARAPQTWHLDSIKKFAVAALVLRGAHATEFPKGAYSDFSAGVAPSKLEEWMQFWRTDSFDTDPGREAESVEEHEHFTRHLTEAQLTTGAYKCEWTKLEVAPAPTAAPGFATTFWSNKVHRGPATAKGEERLVLFCTWLPPGMARKTESETDYSYKACHLEPKLRLSAAASEAAAFEYAGARRTRRPQK